ncbi:MAG: FliA/WhiG family RNA polymerase sigma factor [Rubrobacteraceae bacterium]
MSAQTIGRLWNQYLGARSELSTKGPATEERRNLEQHVGQLRDRLLVNYSPLVKYVTGRVSARMTGAVDREDFMSTGLVGLLNAIQTYDPDREAKFETYAISKIRWAILDEARKEDSLPRRTRSRARQVETARRELSQELQRDPTETELAEKTDLSIADYRSVMQQQEHSQTSSLEASAVDEDGRAFGVQIADEAAIDPESAVEQVERRKELISAMRELSDKERTVVTLYFYQDLTLREIGQALGLTEGRISQILKKTLGKLRSFIGDDQLASDGFV